MSSCDPFPLPIHTVLHLQERVGLRSQRLGVESIIMSISGQMRVLRSYSYTITERPCNCRCKHKHKHAHQHEHRQAQAWP